MVGVMSGLAAGEALLQHIPLKAPKSAGAAAARAVLGLAGLMSVFLGIRAVEKGVEKEHFHRNRGVAAADGGSEHSEAGGGGGGGGARTRERAVSIVSDVPVAAKALRFMRFFSVPVVILVAAPLAFKSVRQREQSVAEMRDAQYAGDGKDAARDDRLKGRPNKSR